MNFINNLLINLKSEFRPMAKLAIPVVIAEVAWVAMGLVDTIMVGRIGAVEIGAVSIGSAIVIFVGLFGLGLFLGLDYLIAKSFGAGDLNDCHHSLIQGLYLAIFVGAMLVAFTWLIIYLLPYSGLEEEIIPLAIDYMKPTSWSIFSLLLYTITRRYLQARNIVKPISWVLVLANLVNLFVNWLLIFGNWGMPRLTSTGAAYATLFSMTFMGVSLFIYIIYIEHRAGTGLFRASFSVDVKRAWAILKIGFPVAIQLTLEVGAFTLATLMAGWLDANSLAAHHIALKVASFTFMVPLGVSAAGSVRIGQAIGRKDGQGAIQAGWTALLFSTAFMAAAGLVLVIFPVMIMRGFTTDANVITAGVSILAIAAFFQLFDGVQVTGSGLLRGLGDTRRPMVMNLIGHWIFGVPIGYLLCFQAQGGIWGLWIGLCVGLIVVSLGMMFYWIRYEKKLAQGITEKEQLELS